MLLYDTRDNTTQGDNGTGMLHEIAVQTEEDRGFSRGDEEGIWDECVL